MRRGARGRLLGTLLPALALGAMLAGCADSYYDRRDTLSFHGGDAAAANRIAHMVDPWPAAASNRQIAGHGERMQRAIERYRTNKTTPLLTTSTSSVQYQPVLAPTPQAGSGPSQ